MCSCFCSGPQQAALCQAIFEFLLMATPLSEVSSPLHIYHQISIRHLLFEFPHFLRFVVSVAACNVALCACNFSKAGDHAWTGLCVFSAQLCSELVSLSHSLSLAVLYAFAAPSISCFCSFQSMRAFRRHCDNTNTFKYSFDLVPLA